MQLNLPLYNITPDMDDVNQGMFLVSLVEEPAVEIDFLAFAKENMLFAVQDTEKHIITGVSILADTPIYRRNQNGEFYVQFRKEDIPAIVEKFMQRGLSNFINIQHDETTLSNTDAILVESYFVNKERGIVPNEFANVTDGSWITSYKIMNEDIWQQIKDGDLRGFSIEISAELEPVKLEKQKTEEEIQDEELLKQCFAEKVPSIFPKINDIIRDVIPTPADNINLDVYSDAAADYAIRNGYIVMLNYVGNSATSSRQCVIGSRGKTRVDGGAGNDALRVYQEFGATESRNQMWKILLTEDITSFHVLPYLQASAAVLGYYGETCGDDPGCFYSAECEAPLV